jgi:hypothetical protein
MTKSHVTNNMKRARHNSKESDDVERGRQMNDDELEVLIRDLYFGAQCGRAAAEYNLERVA